MVLKQIRRMKHRSLPLVWETQTESAMRSRRVAATLTSIRLTPPSAGEDSEQTTHMLLVGMQNSRATLGTSLALSYKVKSMLTV